MLINIIYSDKINNIKIIELHSKDNIIKLIELLEKINYMQLINKNCDDDEKIKLFFMYDNDYNDDNKNIKIINFINKYKDIFKVSSYSYEKTLESDLCKVNNLQIEKDIDENTKVSDINKELLCIEKNKKIASLSEINIEYFQKKRDDIINRNINKINHKPDKCNTDWNKINSIIKCINIILDQSNKENAKTKTEISNGIRAIFAYKIYKIETDKILIKNI